MTRIFTVLSVMALLLMSTTLILGLSIGDFSGTAQRAMQAKKKVSELESRAGEGGDELLQTRADMAQRFRDIEPVRTRATLHKLTGIGAALLAGLVNCLSITYFIGTNRWCKEVIDCFGLDQSLTQRSSNLKVKALPWAVLGIMTILVVAATGGAADPGGNLSSAANWTNAHLWTALVGVTLVGLAFAMQAGIIADNVRLIEQIMQQVEERRRG